jgi:hypothetical protein
MEFGAPTSEVRVAKVRDALRIHCARDASWRSEPIITRWRSILALASHGVGSFGGSGNDGGGRNAGDDGDGSRVP